MYYLWQDQEVFENKEGYSEIKERINKNELTNIWMHDQLLSSDVKEKISSSSCNHTLQTPPWRNEEDCHMVPLLKA